MAGSKKRTEAEAGLDAKTLNARLLGGHRLLVTMDKGRVVACTIEFFGEVVPLALFNAYLADGIIEVPKDGLGYKVSSAGKKRLPKPGGRSY
jgi:hypothetical protein